MELQKGHPADEAYFLLIEATQRRIKTMALMYEHLYQKSDISSVGIRDYFLTLLAYMRQIYSSQITDITYYYEIEDISFPIEIAIPCGLILTELFSNVCRHAFPKKDGGRVTVECGLAGECYYLLVEDNGNGCEDTDVLLQGETLGFQLVRALSEQINGDMEVSSREGLQIRVRFPFYTSSAR